PWTAGNETLTAAAPAREEPCRGRTVDSRPYGSAFHAAREQAADEVALQSEEHEQRNHHGDESTRGEPLPLVAPGARQFREPDRERCRGHVAAREDQRHQQVVPHPQELE